MINIALYNGYRNRDAKNILILPSLAVQIYGRFFITYSMQLVPARSSELNDALPWSVNIEEYYHRSCCGSRLLRCRAGPKLDRQGFLLPRARPHDLRPSFAAVRNPCPGKISPTTARRCWWSMTGGRSSRAESSMSRPAPPTSSVSAGPASRESRSKPTRISIPASAPSGKIQQNNNFLCIEPSFGVPVLAARETFAVARCTGVTARADRDRRRRSSPAKAPGLGPQF